MRRRERWTKRKRWKRRGRRGEEEKV